MPSETSLVRRAAWSSALAASAAALLAAFATIALASYFVQREEDRRLEEAAVTFATELAEESGDLHAIRAVQREESEEMGHTGMLFAVYDANDRLLVGDRRLALPRMPGCMTANANTLRVCRAASTGRLLVVVGAAHTTILPLLASASVLAALLAAALAWIASRPLSRYVVAPLTRLRDRIAQLDVDAISEADLGPPEHVAEVDALRSTIGQLIVRVERALSEAQRFAANAAHELRTPLTSVRAELELLTEAMSESEARADAVRAQQKLGELSVLVERLLILSVPARATDDAHELVSLRDLVEDAMDALPSVDRARVRLPDGDALVRGDAAILATMVTNALSNALKFGSAVTTAIEVADGRAILRVDDDGPGLDDACRERAFEPFFRSADALRRRLPGHGLGLALIRHIARTHGGDAAFFDKAERGARLEIRLPAAESGDGPAV